MSYIEITPGSLEDYSTHMKIIDRRNILKRVVKHEMKDLRLTRKEAAESIRKALIARSNLLVRRSPDASARMKRDANWIKREYKL